MIDNFSKPMSQILKEHPFEKCLQYQIERDRFDILKGSVDEEILNEAIAKQNRFAIEEI